LLESHKISPHRLAEGIFVPEHQILDIIDHRQPMTADLAKRLAKYFNTSAVYWMNLQVSYDLTLCEPTKLEEIRPISWLKPAQNAYNLKSLAK